MWSIIDFVFRHYQNSNQIHKVNNYVHVHVCILKDFTAKSTGNYFDPYQMKKKKTPKETFLLLTWFSYILCWSTDFFFTSINAKESQSWKFRHKCHISYPSPNPYPREWWWRVRGGEGIDTSSATHQRSHLGGLINHRTTPAPHGPRSLCYLTG